MSFHDEKYYCCFALLKTFFCDFFQFFRIFFIPDIICCIFGRDNLSKFHEEVWNITGKHNAPLLPEMFFSLCILPVNMEGKCRLHLSIYSFGSTMKTKLSNLVCSAGGSTSGYVNSRKDSICKMIWFYSFSYTLK